MYDFGSRIYEVVITLTCYGFLLNQHPIQKNWSSRTFATLIL